MLGPRPPLLVFAVRLLWASLVFSLPSIVLEIDRATGAQALVIAMVVTGSVLALCVYLYLSLVQATHRGNRQ